MPVMGNERADLAAASALSLPGMLTWLGMFHSFAKFVAELTSTSLTQYANHYRYQITVMYSLSSFHVNFQEVFIHSSSQRKLSDEE